MNKRDLFKMLAGAGFAVGTTKALARESHAPDLTPVRADDVPLVAEVRPRSRAGGYWAEVKIHMDHTTLEFEAEVLEVSASTNYDMIDVTSIDSSTARFATGLRSSEVNMRMVPIGEIEMS